MLELINRARQDPVAEVFRNVDVNDINDGLPAGSISVAPKPPLAFNLNLLSAARGHNQWMLSAGMFSHTGLNGTSPEDRMAAAGFAPLGTFLGAENLAFAGTSLAVDVPASVERDHNDLFESPSHRLTMLEPEHREIGIAVDVGRFSDSNGLMTTHNFASLGNRKFLTGVVFNDSVTANNFYNVGEGRGAISISARRQTDGALFRTTTYDSGGYQIELESGVYEVQFFGAGISGIVTHFVSIRSNNVKVDLNTLNIPSLSMSLDASTLSENGGTAIATVTRQTDDLSSPLTVVLSSSRPLEATVPSSIVIPVNQSSTTFSIAAVDDAIIDLTQSSIISAKASAFQLTTVLINIIDDDAPSIWQNQEIAFDVDHDGTIAPLDVLLVINRLRRTGTSLAPNNQLSPPIYYDVNGDWFFSPIDVLLIINALNRRRNVASEGESSVMFPEGHSNAHLVELGTQQFNFGSDYSFSELDEALEVSEFENRRCRRLISVAVSLNCLQN